MSRPLVPSERISFCLLFRSCVPWRPGRVGFGRYAPSGLSLPLRFACGPLPLTSRGRLRRPKPLPAGLPKSSRSTRPEHSAPDPPVWPLRVSTEWQVLLHPELFFPGVIPPGDPRKILGRFSEDSRKILGRFSEDLRKILGRSSEWQRHTCRIVRCSRNKDTPFQGRKKIRKFVSPA